MSSFDPRAVEKLCLGLPGATLVVQWHDCRVYKVGGKMFAMIVPDKKAPPELWFKASDLSARLLADIPGIRPAPYLARAGWLAARRTNGLTKRELDAYLRNAHALILERLPKRTRAAIAEGRKIEARGPARRKRRLAEMTEDQ
jgi:predicted DNA-binding protein (MmcQ/YjbR family)